MEVDESGWDALTAYAATADAARERDRRGAGEARRALRARVARQKNVVGILDSALGA
jgi:hypothetical protein